MYSGVQPSAQGLWQLKNLYLLKKAYLQQAVSQRLSEVTSEVGKAEYAAKQWWIKFLVWYCTQFYKGGKTDKVEKGIRQSRVRLRKQAKQITNKMTHLEPSVDLKDVAQASVEGSIMTWCMLELS